MGIIYLIKNKANGKCYVGQTTQKLKTRIAKHVNAANNGSTQLIHKAMRKYGIDSFDITILENCDNKDLDRLENKMIKTYRGMVPSGYNLKGGGHSSRYSKESRKKMSLAHKGIPLSEEHKRRISQSCKGNIGPWKGKKFSKAHRENISKGNSGKKFTEETKLKISKALTGKNNPMFGKTSGKNPNAKPITLILPNGKLEKFNSMTDACNKYDLDIRNLSVVAAGRRKSHKGFGVKI